MITLFHWMISHQKEAGSIALLFVFEREPLGQIAVRNPFSCAAALAGTPASEALKVSGNCRGLIDRHQHGLESYSDANHYAQITSNNRRHSESRTFVQLMPIIPAVLRSEKQLNPANALIYNKTHLYNKWLFTAMISSYRCCFLINNNNQMFNQP